MILISGVLCFQLGCGGNSDSTSSDSEAAEPSKQEETASKPDTLESLVRGFESYVEVEALFDSLDYTHDSWLAGVRIVPRVFLTQIPSRWREKTTKEVSVQTKKRLFFRALGPPVLRSNELILADREKLLSLESRIADSDALSSEEQAWLLSTALSYRVVEEDATEVSASDLEALRSRVDIVPISIALSQAAEESGWGTSRFADEGNSLFGQWSWSGGIKPKDQRSGMGDYGIAAFDSPFASVQGYVQNLNTHRAYEKFRAKRSELRSNDQPISGTVLVETLDKYSERGYAYVETLKSIMRVNKLIEAEEAYLADGPTYFLQPIGDDAD
jgi:uncharacterized FlgJ-related protein